MEGIARHSWRTSHDLAAVAHRPHPVHYYAPHAGGGGTPASVIIIVVIAVAALGLITRWRR